MQDIQEVTGQGKKGEGMLLLLFALLLLSKRENQEQELTSFVFP